MLSHDKEVVAAFDAATTYTWRDRLSTENSWEEMLFLFSLYQEGEIAGSRRRGVEEAEPSSKNKQLLLDQLRDRVPSEGHKFRYWLRNFVRCLSKVADSDGDFFNLFDHLLSLAFNYSPAHDYSQWVYHLGEEPRCGIWRFGPPPNLPFMGVEYGVCKCDES